MVPACLPQFDLASMSSNMIPAFVQCCVARLGDTHPSNSRLCSRRAALASFLNMPSLLLLSSFPPPLASPPSDPMDPHRIAVALQIHCSPFIKSLSYRDPSTPMPLLWRGSTPTPAAKFIQCSPVPDLLEQHTYGEQGVTFFKYLEQYMKSSKPPSDRVLPSKSHIATGSRSVASQWGTPVTVWPIGDFRYAFWEEGQLIYAPGEDINQAFSRGKQLVIGKQLREAILAGKEIMFDSSAFFELREDIAGQVIANLMK